MVTPFLWVSTRITRLRKFQFLLAVVVQHIIAIIIIRRLVKELRCSGAAGLTLRLLAFRTGTCPTLRAMRTRSSARAFLKKLSNQGGLGDISPISFMEESFTNIKNKYNIKMGYAVRACDVRRQLD